MPAFWLEHNPDPTGVSCASNIPYDATLIIHKDATCSTMHDTTPIKTTVGLNDHILHKEVFVLLFAVENYLSISKVSSLVKFAQCLSKNLKALSGLKQDRTLANYKLKEGLTQYNHESLVTKLESKHFFLNLDEYTANNKKKIFRILVSFFDDDHGDGIVAHCNSILMTHFFWN